LHAEAHVARPDQLRLGHVSHREGAGSGEEDGLHGSGRDDVALALAQRASGALLETAKLGVAEWTTASLYQVGAIYESFAQALMRSPAPSTLSAQQAEEYKMQLDEFVVPIEEKSLEAYESGWQKALELGIFNAWTARMREALGRLNTEVYPPLSEVGFRLRSEAAGGLPELLAAPRRGDTGKSLDFLMGSPPPAAAAPAVRAARVSQVESP
jgi:hypothetical protein